MEHNEQSIEQRLELGDPNLFGATQKYYGQWLPQMAKLVLKDQEDIFKNYVSNTKNEVDRFLVLLSPEKFAVITLRLILKHVLLKISKYKNSKTEQGIMDSENDIYELNIKDLTVELSRSITKEIVYEFECENFQKKLEEREFSKNQITTQMEAFKKKFIEENTKSDLQLNAKYEDMIPYEIKMKLSSIMLNYGSPRSNGSDGSDEGRSPRRADQPEAFYQGAQPQKQAIGPQQVHFGLQRV